MTLVKNVQFETAAEEEDFFTKLIDEVCAGEDLTPWNGDLRQYLPMVAAEPTLNDLAHTRVWRMIEKAGIEFNEADEKQRNPKFKFFEKDLFGVDSTITQIMQYLKAASAGSEVSKRILLLWGPTSSGKSQFAILLKKGLEAFTRTREGRMFGIEGCPMHENPLNALPENARKVLKEKYGLIIEGELCPRCAYRLNEEFKGDFWKIPVKRIFFSEMHRVGIGTFQPADQKSQSQSELVGSVNFAQLENYGVESHPMAYNFDGELNVANRGMMEFIEMLKLDPKFRYILLTLAQEKRIKVERFPLIYADILNVAHSVVGDTPIPYRKDGKIGIAFIQDLEKENNTNIEVLAADAHGQPIWTNVISFHKHQFSGKLIKTVQKNGIVDTTWNHSIIGRDLNPFYPEEKKDILAFRKLPLIEEIKSFTIPLPDSLQNIEDKVFVKPTGIKKADGEFGKYSINYTYNTNSKKAKDVLRVFCWFATEGHANEQHAIISQNNLETLKIIATSAENISTTKASIHDRSETTDKTSRLHLSARVWRDILSHNCGKYSQNKRLPDFICNLPKELRIFVLEELCKGDGQLKPSFKSSLQYAENYFSFKTTSKILAAQVAFLASSLDYDFNVYHGYTQNGKEYFGIRFREKSIDKKGTNRIEVIEVEDMTVYDIECQDNHSFTGGVGNVVCHNTNEVEYNKFLANKSEEALHDRLWVIKFPYNLQLKNEVKIYEKLVCHTPGFRNVHIAPHTLYITAMFALLSRLEEPKDKSITLLQKMYLYDGDEVDGFSQEDVKELQKAAEREGLDGVSPRYIVNRLAACFAKHNVSYITPLTALMSVKEGLSTNAKLDKESVQKLENLISVCVSEYDKIACSEVQKAFFINYEQEVANLLSNYIDNVGAYLDDTKMENEWGEMVVADEQLMRSVEEKIEISTTGKASFREEVYRKMIRSKGETGKYDYQSHPRLREALQKQLFAERSDVIRLTVSIRNPDPEALKKINEVVKVLSDLYGYTPESANELLRYVSSIMSKSG